MPDITTHRQLLLRILITHWLCIAHIPIITIRSQRIRLLFGLGYRGSVIYADLAYKYDMYKSKFYPFDDVELKAAQVDNSRHQLLFTVGARF
mgnify:FL=1